MNVRRVRSSGNLQAPSEASGRCLKLEFLGYLGQRKLMVAQKEKADPGCEHSFLLNPIT